jgi:aldehyde:ferredoxin oxidoreductase
VSGIDKMIPEYYQIRGWTPEGVVTEETVARLGL